MITLFLTTSYSHKKVIYIIGDSTAAEKEHVTTSPERGWGMMLQGFFSKNVIVRNYAVNGRSSKSFIDEGRWQTVLQQVTPGNYVFIQFGHNDEKPDVKRHTEPGTTFDANLRRFVKETRERGGVPVLLTPVVRRNFYRQSADGRKIEDEALRSTIYADEKVNSDTLIDTHGCYVEAVRRIAKEQQTLLVDANKITHDIESRLGIVGSRSLHMWLKPGELSSIPQGRQDNTHYNVHGARLVAGGLADEMGRVIPNLRKYVVHYDFVVSTEGRGNFFSLSDAITHAPAHVLTRIYVLDGQHSQPFVPKNKKIKIIWGEQATVK